MVNRVFVVMGANYGDEGKGLVSAIHALRAQIMNKKCLTVLYNGGAQRGHTVETDDYRHVFHHLAAGSLFNSSTYMSEDFIINPIVFMHEVNTLHCTYPDIYGLNYRIYVNGNCRVTTPFDIAANQADRTNLNNGSCGLGIFQTRKRYENRLGEPRYATLIHYSPRELYNWAIGIANWYKVQGVFFGNGEIENSAIVFASDFEQMKNKVCRCDIVDLTRCFDTIVFEGAQGLALSEDNVKDFPHLTPSLTGVDNPLKEIAKMNLAPEDALYGFEFVTRPYFTRHGYGPFPTEDDSLAEEYGLEDKTNVFNAYQKSFRYGKFNVDEMMQRIAKEKQKVELAKLHSTSFEVIVTHGDELPEDYVMDTIYQVQNQDIDGVVKVDSRFVTPNTQLRFYDSKETIL